MRVPIDGLTETLNSEIMLDRNKRDAAVIDLSDASSMATMSSEVMEDAYLDFVSTVFSYFFKISTDSCVENKFVYIDFVQIDL